MSGDVQPRKRKDKRKKKDEVLDYLNYSSPDDIIHVHKDAFLGGNVCSKVVFFCLLGALGVMVSLIIFEYRGSNDLETQSAVDSPWAKMLEGWVDSVDTVEGVGSITHDQHDDHEEDDELGVSGEDHSGQDDDDHDEEVLDDSYEHDDDDDDDDDDADEEVDEDNDDDDDDDEVDEEEDDEEEEEDDDDEDDEEEEDEVDEEEEDEVDEEDEDEDDEDEEEEDDEDEEEEDDEDEEEEEEEDDEEDEEENYVDMEEKEAEEDDEKDGDDEEEEEEEEENYDDDDDDDDDKEDENDNAEDDDQERSEEEEEDDDDDNDELENKSEEIENGDDGYETIDDEDDDDDDVDRRIGVSKRPGKKIWKMIKKHKSVLLAESGETDNNVDGNDNDDDDDANDDGNDDDNDGDEGIQKDKRKDVDGKILKKRSKRKAGGGGDDGIVEKFKDETEEGESEDEEESSGVALKFGVGVALVVVAHVVLVKKWNSIGAGDMKPATEVFSSSPNESASSATAAAEELSELETPELLSRRKTLVAPSLKTEDIQCLHPPSPLQDEYSEDEGEEEEEEEEDDEEGVVESEHVKQTLDDLKAAYADITPEASDIEEDYGLDSTTKTYDYVETPPDSGAEQSEPEEETEDEDEEEEDDPQSQWQSKQSAHLLAEEVEDLQTGSEEEESESDGEAPPPPPPQQPVVRRRGPQDIVDESEQFFQDLLFDTFEKDEQPLEQLAAKSEQSTSNAQQLSEPNEEISAADVREIGNRSNEEEAEDLWEPMSTTESDDESEQLANAIHEEEEETATEPTVDQQTLAKEEYFNRDITNDYDWEIHDELDAAEAELNQGHAELALTMFSSLLVQAPLSVRAHHGKAHALDRLAELRRSNALLLQAITAYLDALRLDDSRALSRSPDKLFKAIADRAIDRMRFKGMHLDAVEVHNKLISRFPDSPLYRNQLAVTYLMINRLSDAEKVLSAVVERWPTDGWGSALYGLLLKLQGHHALAVPHLRAGLSSNAPNTNHSNFYFHLGDALTRLNKYEEALQVYEDATAKGLLRSKFQRSLYNVDRLTARPWWSIEQTTYQQFFRKLEKNWKTIRDEGVAALKHRKGYVDEAENLRQKGDWKQLEIFARGRKSVKNCELTPVTCGLIEQFRGAAGCRRGQTKFSVMTAGTHVWPHCGPTNTRLRAHLGLVVPPNVFIRVADQLRSWEEGKVMIFDDSFEHEVWHNGTEQRLVLIVDIWHPELTEDERRSLSAI